MLFLRTFFLVSSSFIAAGQRYAEREPIPADPMPIVDEYDYDDATDGHDFNEELDIYRWNIKDYPHPKQNPRFCNRMKPSYVCDPDSILDKEQADRLDSFIKTLYKETPCICDDCEKGEGGIVIGVALLKYMYQPYNVHPSKIIRQYSENLREKWKLGKCDNDILIVVAVMDRLSYTDVGKSTSSYVSLEEAHRIFLENKSHFSDGRFYQGLNAMLQDFHKSTRDMKRPVEKKLDVALVSGVIIGTVAILGVLLFVGVVIYRKCRSKNVEKRKPDRTDSSEGVSSSWTKQDIKVMFSSLKSSKQPAKYQACKTDEKDSPVDGSKSDDDITLAIPEDNNETQLTNVSAAGESSAEILEKELTTAAEGIAKTFPSGQTTPLYRGHMTDL